MTEELTYIDGPKFGEKEIHDSTQDNPLIYTIESKPMKHGEKRMLHAKYHRGRQNTLSLEGYYIQ